MNRLYNKLIDNTEKFMDSLDSVAMPFAFITILYLLGHIVAVVLK